MRVARPDKGRIPVRGRGTANSIVAGGGDKEEFDFVLMARCRIAPIAGWKVEVKPLPVALGPAGRHCDFWKAGKHHV